MIRSLFRAVYAVLAFTAIAAAQAQEKKPDPTGTWCWSETSPGGSGTNAPTVSTLKLKADGEKLNGTLLTPGRGGQVREVAIADGKVKGAQISFSVTGEFNGMRVVAKYSGKVAGDVIKGKMDAKVSLLRLFSAKKSMDWEATRLADNK